MHDYILITDDELYHYGVKGMKWGVRRDARILANHRRNKRVKQIDDDYKSGKITAEKRKELKRQADQKKKKYLDDIAKAYERATTDRERESLNKSITDATLSEVPNVSLKRGLATVNTILGVRNSASVGLTAYSLATLNPAFAGAAITAGVVGVAAETGFRYVTQLGLDKAS